MTAAVLAFVHELRFEHLPAEVVTTAKRCLLDLAGVACAGSETRLSRIARDHAARHLAAGDGGAARLLLDGRPASAVGAAFAVAASIDSFDAHDGHALTKGHAGIAALSAILAFADRRRGQSPFSGAELLTCLVLGYEIGTRAGIALHATARDYHSSGAWNALACAAIGARALGLDADATRHALGIAEYHGPRGPMMRCIDHPTMVKDGSAQGALAGVAASLLAAEGFAGAPSELVEGFDTAHLWADLGQRFRILEQYLKPYPVCRWAQPAIEAALALKRAHGFGHARIARITVRSFREAVRLAVRRPETTEEAQYGLPFPLAAALVRGGIGTCEMGADGLADPAIGALAERIALEEVEEYSARFPAERLAEIAIVLDDGRELVSAPTVARGGPENPLPDDEIRAKFDRLAAPVLGTARAGALAEAIAGLERRSGSGFLDLLLEPPPRDASTP